MAQKSRRLRACLWMSIKSFPWAPNLYRLHLAQRMRHMPERPTEQKCLV